MIDTLGDRIKKYEDCYNVKLTNRIPVVIRIDGKAFHNWTKKSKCVKPFDKNLVQLMSETTKYLCNNISGCVCGYCQSDEISLLLINSQTPQTQPWFDNRLQKISSISSSLATYYFNEHNTFEIKYPALFDSRTFIIPENDVLNYFIWRQRDSIRNSISMLAQSLYSPKQLHKKTSEEKIEICKLKGSDWNLLPHCYTNGVLVYKSISNIPLQNKVTGEVTYRKRFVVDDNIDVFKYTNDCIITKILKDNNINVI